MLLGKAHIFCGLPVQKKVLLCNKVLFWLYYVGQLWLRLLAKMEANIYRTNINCGLTIVPSSDEENELNGGYIPAYPEDSKVCSKTISKPGYFVYPYGISLKFEKVSYSYSFTYCWYSC